MRKAMSTFVLALSLALTLGLPAWASFIVPNGSITTAKIADGAATTQKIADGAVTRAKREPLGQIISASSGAFSTTSTTAVAVTNLSVTITTTGRPVVVMLVPDGTSNFSQLSVDNGTTAASVGINLLILRGATTVAYTSVAINGSSTIFTSIGVPPSSLAFIDTPVAGTYTYSIKAYIQQPGDTARVLYSKLMAYEL